MRWRRWSGGGCGKDRPARYNNPNPDPRRRESFELAQAVLDLITEAATILGTTDDALAWISAPNRSLGGIAPRGLFEKGLDGVHEARAILFKLEEGIYS